MKQVLHLIDKINNITGHYVSYLIFPLIGLVVYTVVTRYFLSMSNIWAYETTQFMFGAFFVLGGGYIAYKNGHVNVDILFSRFSKRTQAIISLFTALFFFIFIGAMVWLGWQAAWSSLKMGERTDTAWGPPVYPIKFAIPVGAFLLLLQGIAKFIRDLRIATGKESDEH